MNGIIKITAILAAVVMAGCTGNQTFKLEKGDRIAIVGNSLAERMQHDGWLETYLQATYPDDRLVFRNLGYSGDQVHYRPRAHKGFGDSDSHLKNMRANVLFAFFGYNESFENKPEEFRQQLGAWIDHVRTQPYDSLKTPRIVLFSPIAHENLETPNLPDGSENNVRLQAYTDVMAAVAKEKDVPFVDLFAATQKMYADSETPLTLNGVHLNEKGNEEVARYIVETAFGSRIKMDRVAIDSLRSAVVDKNGYWFHRYRTISGNDVWGTRSIQDGNYATLQRELQMLDTMTANRDKRVWARAQGNDIEIDDSNVPEPLIVGTHITREVTYVDPEEAIDRMTFPGDLQVNLFASEKEFPEIAKPVAMQIDTKGQVWVASWATYPKWEPMRPMNDRLVTLTDTDNDGVADKATTFAFVPHPTGFEFWNDGVIVVSAPDILFLKDTTGDGVADVRTRLFGGIGSDDTHHTANNLIYGPDGNIYYQRGIFILENVETPWRKSDESGTPGLYRLNPRTFDFSFVVENSPNAHGISFDKWGNQFITDGTTGKAFQVYYDRKVTSTTDSSRFAKRPLFEPTVRPLTSNQLISSANLPAQYQNNFLVYNVIGFQGMKRYRLDYKPQGVVEGTEIGNFLFTGNDPAFTPHTEAAPRVVPPDYTGDPNFRPSDGAVGLDGALYFADWQNAVITHSPYNLRDASRDQIHGRVYRVTAKNKPVGPAVRVHGESIENLLELFKNPYDNIRHQARVELSGRNSDEVIKKAQAWAGELDRSETENALPLLEVLWLHQQHNRVNRELLVELLKSPEEPVRIAAQKVAWFWSERASHLAAPDPAGVPGMEFRIGYESFWADRDSSMTGAPDAAHAGHGKETAETPSKGKAAAAPALDFREKETAALTIVAVRMEFDVSAFTVKAGQRVELTLDNQDLMQHNLLIVAPGAADEVAGLAIDLQEEGLAKAYVPESGKVLHHTGLLDGHTKEVLSFRAPTAPGDYPFVCTFPGHAPVMRGIMHVK